MSGSVSFCYNCRSNEYAGRPCPTCGEYVVGLRDVHAYYKGLQEVYCLTCDWQGTYEETANAGNGPICPDCQDEIAEKGVE